MNHIVSLIGIIEKYMPNIFAPILLIRDMVVEFEIVCITAKPYIL